MVTGFCIYIHWYLRLGNVSHKVLWIIYKDGNITINSDSMIFNVCVIHSEAMLVIPRITAHYHGPRHIGSTGTRRGRAIVRRGGSIN